MVKERETKLFEKGLSKVKCDLQKEATLHDIVVWSNDNFNDIERAFDRIQRFILLNIIGDIAIVIAILLLFLFIIQ